MLITFRRYIILQKHVILRNPALFLTTCRLKCITRSVEVIQSCHYKVGVYVNEDDFINSNCWRRNWTSLCIHRQSRCGKNSFGWGMVAGMDNIILASNDNLGWISFCDFHQAKTSSRAIHKHLDSWISSSPVPVKWTCFDSRSCLPFSWNWRLHGQTERSGILVHFDNFSAKQ